MPPEAKGIAVPSSPATHSHLQQPLWSKRFLLAAGLLAVLTVLLYLPVRHDPFLNLDDNQYVTGNANIEDGLTWQSVYWSFTSYYSFNWHPLTWMSHALDIQLFGLDPAGPHLVNLALHVMNVLLLFWVLVRATGYLGRSAAVAALFAIHPINVESVAWIAERKNVLSMLFFLLALGAYRWYVQRPSRARYAMVALWFALGLMAKPQIVTLPFLLLLWDYWPLRRVGLPWDLDSTANGATWWKLVGEKLPLFALCIFSSILTLRAQEAGGAVASFVKFPLHVRMENALLAYMRYIGKLIWPSRLAPMYFHLGMAIPKREVAIALVLLLGITVAAVKLRRRYLLVGWLWFLGTLVPMIGIVQVGNQSMADRYAYLPFIGLFLMICWGVPDLLDDAGASSVARYAALTAGLLVITVLLLTTHRQLEYWEDNIRLWSHAEAVTTQNAFFENRIADELLQRGEPEAAMQHFERAVEIRPTDYDSNFALAVYRQRTGNLGAAIRHYQMVVDSPASVAMKARALTYMGRAYRELGDTAKQRECLEAAERLQH